MESGVDRKPNMLVLYFSNVSWRRRLHPSGDNGQDSYRRQVRLGDDWGTTPVGSEIGKIYLRQNEDQHEQQQFEDKQGPTPRLHGNPIFSGKNLFPPAMPVKRGKPGIGCLCLISISVDRGSFLARACALSSWFASPSSDSSDFRVCAPWHRSLISESGREEKA
jgi:hypothetical protein